jgi:S-adenosylmethionine hydrolase
MPFITLLTDFGQADTYVGQVKGAILSVAPSATVVDLTHAVPPQDVRAGAFLLWSAVGAFASGCVHLAVVDPGVGSKRRPLAVRSASGHYLVGPDNGLLVPALDRLGGIEAAFELRNPSYWRPTVSRTFHARDLFGPIAAHLALGVALRELGSPVDQLERPFSIPAPARDASGLRGEVLHVDRYGSLITNITEDLVPERFFVRLRADRIAGSKDSHYQEVSPGELIALIGSAGLVEVAARNASAAAVLGVGVGDPLQVEP